MQRMVSRLSNPYGECTDPKDIDKMHNAYSEHYSVVYTAQVSMLCPFIYSKYSVSIRIYTSTVSQKYRHNAIKTNLCRITQKLLYSNLE